MSRRTYPPTATETITCTQCAAEATYFGTYYQRDGQAHYADWIRFPYLYKLLCPLCSGHRTRMPQLAPTMAETTQSATEAEIVAHGPTEAAP